MGSGRLSSSGWFLLVFITRKETGLVLSPAFVRLVWLWKLIISGRCRFEPAYTAHLQSFKCHCFRMELGGFCFSLLCSLLIILNVIFIYLLLFSTWKPSIFISRHFIFSFTMTFPGIFRRSISPYSTFMELNQFIIQTTILLRFLCSNIRS